MKTGKESVRIGGSTYRAAADGRPGADCLKDSRAVRVSPLWLLSARFSGIQVVPRKCTFSPWEFVSQGVFFMEKE